MGVAMPGDVHYCSECGAVDQLQQQFVELSWYVAELQHTLRKLMMAQILSQPQMQEFIAQRVAQQLTDVLMQ